MRFIPFFWILLVCLLAAEPSIRHKPAAPKATPTPGHSATPHLPPIKPVTGPTLEEVYGRWKQAFLKLPGCAGATVGIWVGDETGATVFGDGEETNLVPASCQKVLTAAVVLDKLPLDSTLTTRVLFEPRRKELALVGGGDPELTSQQLANLAALQARRLTGQEVKVLVDAHIFAEPPFPPGWAWDDQSEPYAAEVRGLTLDHGFARVTLQAGPAEGQPVGVNAPEWFGPIVNLCVVGSERNVQWLRLPGQDSTIVLGTVPAGTSVQESVALCDSDLAAGRCFAAELRKAGVKVVSVERLSSPPSVGWQEVGKASSRPLDGMLREALAESDNLVIECLYRLARRARPEALAGNEQIRLADGCGLSRYNLISPHALGSVLVAQPKVVDYLPVAGQEGTLRNRFVASALENVMRAKTGTMSGVSSLAGSFPVSARRYVVVLISNGTVGATRGVKLAEDKLFVDIHQSLLRGYKPPKPPAKGAPPSPSPSPEPDAGPAPEESPMPGETPSASPSPTVEETPEPEDTPKPARPVRGRSGS